MKAMIAQQVHTIGITFKPVAVIIFLMLIFFMGILMVVRQQCIRQGYEISRLTGALEQRTLEYEGVSKEYSDVFRREILFGKAEGLGFTLPVGGHVFYVQR